VGLGPVCSFALDVLREAGWSPRLTFEEYEAVASAGFHTKTLPLAFVASDLLATGQPMTLRGLFYQVVSASWLPSTGSPHYKRLGRIMTVLREKRIVPFRWLVDHVRTTLKPSSWSGLTDFADTVRDAYRRDFWAQLPAYVHIFVEKDAMAGVLAQVTQAYDVPLSIIRGGVSLSFAHEIAELWDQIEKPIFAYYLGDHDPSGLRIEIDLRDKLQRYCERPNFAWQRIAVTPEDFGKFNLFPLKPKETDPCTRWFREQGFEDCAELDAIPAPELRNRVETAILEHVPADEWERLQHIERLEQEQWRGVLKKLNPRSARRK
jgi:hypothetical protein